MAQCWPYSFKGLASVSYDYTNVLGIPVLGVINPGAAHAVDITKNGKIGVLATHATVKSQSYIKAIKNIDHQKALLGSTATVTGNFAIWFTMYSQNCEHSPAKWNIRKLMWWIIGIAFTKTAIILEISAMVIGILIIRLVMGPTIDT